MTICPPRDSNTALYHDFVKAGNGSLSDKNKITLKKAVYDIFMEQPHRVYMKTMVAISNIANVDQVFQGFHSLPTPYNDANGLKIKMWN